MTDDERIGMMDFTAGLLLKLTVLVVSFGVCWGQCVFPGDLHGRWISSDVGQLNISHNIIHNYPMVLGNVSTLDFLCHKQKDSKYVLKSTSTVVIIGQQMHAYFCIDLHAVSRQTFWYHIATKLLNFPEVTAVFRVPTVDPDVSEVCDVPQPYSVGSYLTLVKAEPVENGWYRSRCPDDLVNVFTNGSITTADGTVTCDNSTLDVCTDDTRMTVRHNPCGIHGYGESLVCLTDRTDDSTNITYLYLWVNNTLHNNKIHCFVYLRADDELVGTLYPGSCTAFQTPTVVRHPALSLHYAGIEDTCEEEIITTEVVVHTTSTEQTDITGVVIGVICAVVVVVVVIVMFKTRCKCIPCIERKFHSKSISHSEIPYSKSHTANQNAFNKSGMTKRPISVVGTGDHAVSVNGVEVMAENPSDMDRTDKENEVTDDVRKNVRFGHVTAMNSATGRHSTKGRQGRNLDRTVQNNQSTANQSEIQQQAVLPFLVNGQIITDMIPPLKVELLYKVDTKPTSDKAKFDSKQFLSETSLRTNDYD